MNPIASGGYAWVVFTSRRMYGNVAQIGPWVSDPRHYPWQDQITDKKLWVAAVDLNGKPGTDPSHPAFYLPAQELHAGNARGYWTVEPCRGDGQGCMTGDQCCAGFCEAGAGRRARVHVAGARLLGAVREVHDDERLLRRSILRARLHEWGVHAAGAEITVFDLRRDAMRLCCDRAERRMVSEGSRVSESNGGSRDRLASRFCGCSRAIGSCWCRPREYRHWTRG